MKLKTLLINTGFRNIENISDVVISSIEHDSRKVKENSLFIVIKGFNSNAKEFIPQAITNGCVAVIAEEHITGLDVPFLKCENSREMLGLLSRTFYAKEVDNLFTVGITGTNGKTTQAYLIDRVLNKKDKAQNIIGTIAHYCAGEKINSENTTPEAPDVFSIMSKASQKGEKNFIMEVSSHALILKRVFSHKFDVTLFSNLTRDHLDFHGNIDEYFNAKKILFTENLKQNGTAIINIDDNWSKKIIESLSNDKKIITYGRKDNATIKLINVEYKENVSRITFLYNNKTIIINTNLIGEFNAYNILAAFAVGIVAKLNESEIIKTLESIWGVSGRFERIKPLQTLSSKHADFFIDYAHTPDALERVLDTANTIKEKKLICVFGCGGDRDKGKRALMAKASLKADKIIITSDNPRTEEPKEIINDILKGITSTCNYSVIVERAEAIESAVINSNVGDVVLVAGKGHEDYQITKNGKLHFDDKEEIQKALNKIEL